MVDSPELIVKVMYGNNLEDWHRSNCILVPAPKCVHEWDANDMYVRVRDGQLVAEVKCRKCPVVHRSSSQLPKESEGGKT